MTNPRRQKPEPFDVVVREVVRETADAVTLVFEVLAEPPSYLAGQFLTIDPQQFKALASHLAFLEDLKGRKELARAYSMSSAPNEPLAITIKEERYIPNHSKHAALLSPFLVHATPVGTRLTVSGFTGAYNLPPDIEERTDQISHVVAGSGMVPSWSILKSSLREHPRLCHTVVYSNTVLEDVIFAGALSALACDNPSRLRVIHTLTRQSKVDALPAGVRLGRISFDLLAEVAPDSRTALAYVCGPAINPWDRRAAMEAGIDAKPRFLESTLGFLKALGFASDRIRREAFG